MVIHALASFLALIIALNTWGWHLPWLGLVLGLAWLSVTSWLVGGRLGGLTANPEERLAWGVIVSLIVVSIVGTVLFYLNLFSAYTLAGLIVLLPWFGKISFIPHQSPPETTNDQQPAARNQWLIILLTLTYLSLTLITWLTISASHTAEAIRTPWAVVPGGVFLLYGLTAFALLWLTRYLKHPLWLTPFYLLSLSVLVLIYPLGFGFDTFIHQASEKLLALTGTINPKPLYYLGQYSLTTFLAQALHLPLEHVDAWLVPGLASVTIPLAFTHLARQLKLQRPWLVLLGVLPLGFALSAFTYTTPQGLSYLWALLTFILLAARRLGASVPRFIPWLAGLATLAAHPLTGLPVLGALGLWWVTDYGGKLKHQRRAWWLAATAGALGVPLAFVLLSWLKPSAAGIAFSSNLLQNITQLGSNIAWHLPFLPRFVDLPDAIYLWGRPLILLFLILAAVGFWQAKAEHQRLRLLAQLAALPLISYLLLALFATFPNLPPNEQDFYTVRLWELALLALWPLALWGAYRLGNTVLQRLRHPTTWTAAGTLILTASFYLTFPRLDVWHRDTAYNTTPYDIEAVRLVAAQSDSAPYVVLANQAVAAAAVREFGFTHYYTGHFYYPLPTGTNPLYQVYLNAAERGLPTRDIISRAAELGVPQVFLVLNRYWADYDTLHQVAQGEADAWWEVAEGRITVYRYDF
ncbi:MAG: hypothetical protein U1C53_02495 [Candidatus Veblenbacteria bacterium]|nr:hypothetical protein [Candidatus Veblenbacteria bacterium]MDZ4229983.1 hypothetical protein [Candidatus Veblenbacteria bacterium]